jgi:hypothetical protein
MRERNVPNEKSPAEAYTRDEPLVIWTDDNTKLEVFAESGGVASVAGGAVARIANPQWIVRAKGVERAGWGEATIYESLTDVRENALRWWRSDGSSKTRS